MGLVSACLPQRFGDYELIEEIARGGMGVVFKARQLTLNRTVAIKMILAGHLASDVDVQRFRREAQAIARLQHPNIVTVHEVGEHDGQHYFSMEHVDGRSLADSNVRNSFTPLTAAACVETLAEAIHYAHQSGILHRDLKPSNVLMDSSGRPRITDFGLAREMSLPDGLTITGQVLGSPNFMPPEQAAGTVAEFQPASDVYSLGAILFFLLTGRPPFIAETIAETLEQVRHRNALSPRVFNPGLPRDLETICLKCLEKEPHRRFSSAHELAADLARFRRGEPIHARALSKLELGLRWCRRHPTVAGLTTALVVAIAAGFIGVTWQWQQSQQAARNESLQRQRSEQLSAQLELQLAEQAFAGDNASVALAHLARLVRRQPTNFVAVERLLSALTHRNFAVPAVPPLVHSGSVVRAQFVSDFTQIASASTDGAVTLWDAATGSVVKQIKLPRTIERAAFSPDGRYAFTAERDGTGHLCETRTSSNTPLPAAGGIAATFSPSGVLLATASTNGVIRIWRTSDGQLATAPLQQGSAVEKLQFSDEQLLASAGQNGTRLWNTQNGGGPPNSLEHNAAVHDVAFTSDGRLLTASEDKKARIWNLALERSVLPPLVHEGPVYSIQLSASGSRILTASGDSTARVWDLRGTNVVAVKHRLPVIEARWSADERRFATASLDTTARVWDASDGKPLIEPIRHEGKSVAMEFNRAGDQLLTWSRDARVQLWSLKPAAAQSLALQHDAGVVCANFSADGKLIVTGSRDGTAQIWDATSGSRRGKPLRHAQGITWAEFNRDGERVVTASEDGTAQVWNVRTSEPIAAALRHSNSVSVAHFSPDGRSVLTASLDGTTRIWESGSGRELYPALRHPRAVRDAAFSFDGTQIVTSGDDGAARIWNTLTGAPIGHELRHEKRVLCARFSPDGRFVVTGSGDHTARIWNAVTGLPIGEPLKHNGDITAVEFNPESDRVATASIDGTARVWDARTGRPLTSGLSHEGRVNSVQFSSDGHRLATASGDYTVRVWDAETGRATSEPLRHRNWVYMARFSPDGRRVISASTQRSAVLWNVPRATGPAPDWLPSLAEGVGGARFNHSDLLEPVFANDLLAMEAKLARPAEHDPYIDFARTLFARQGRGGLRQ